ncbi:50S ribosomal protein L6 [Buchnera aphidicola (Ceratoglyphina bambusae)]|uniref:50S ribosomal protein L6 n=1 Tax=Buchnera aphidicola TaxID=9 RepID=UPI0031B8981C
MSRIAKKPILVPKDVKIFFKKKNIYIEGLYGKLKFVLNNFVNVEYNKNVLTFYGNKKYYNSWMYAGTARSLIFSMIYGVKNKFFKTLVLSGVGYRVILKNNVVNLFLGYSHVIKYTLPIGVEANCDSNTKITLSGVNKQLVFQSAAVLRSYKKPEPYKGKGIHYENEIIRRKEAKKK